MSRAVFPILISPLLLVGCGAEPMQRLGCLQSGDELVIVSRNDPTALDGYGYHICTARTANPQCGKYNRLTAERPLFLTVSLAAGKARVTQAGGSIFDYSTDPAGMRDADFEKAVPLELVFTSQLPTASAKPIYQLNGKPTHLGSCPKM